MGSHHFTNCTNPECGVESRALKPGSRCPHCLKSDGGKGGKRQRDPKVPSLVVREMKSQEIVSIVPVTSPYITIMGVERYEHIMAGMIRNMDMERFLIDDSEFD